MEIGSPQYQSKIRMATSSVKSLNWKYLGMTNGDGSISLPSEWNELHIEAGETDVGSSELRYLHSAHVVRIGLPSTGKFYYAGEYRDSSNNCQVIFLVTTTTAKCAYYYSKGQSIISSVQFRAWYR